MNRIALCQLILLVCISSTWAEETSPPDFNEHVLPVLHKYCAACHYGEEGEASLGLDSYEAILKGGDNGAVITPGHSETSRLIRVVTGQAEPAMPPEDNEAPTPEEIAVLRAWIDAGAKSPEGAAPDPTVLVTPKVELQAALRDAVTAVAVSPSGDFLAVARYGTVQIQSLPDRQVRHTLEGHRGSVNAVDFSDDGSLVVAAAGEAGLFGEARLWRTDAGQLQQVMIGHKDSLYAAELSPDGRLLATAGYDQAIILWDIATGEPLRTLEGHNGPVFDLAFHPSSELLASASGDRTVKIWKVADGTRLDTLNQSLQELYTVAFRPDGSQVAAAGVDNRLRVWQISSSGQEGTNPLLESRFAHEAAVLNLAYSPDGRTLVSTGEDRRVKVWDAERVRLARTLPVQPDWTSGLAITPDNRTLLVGRLDGSVGLYNLPSPQEDAGPALEPLDELPPVVIYPEASSASLQEAQESEPNNEPAQANPLQLHAQVSGRIQAADEMPFDVDVFRFEAKKDDQWVLETRAAQDGSPVDTKIQMLHEDGRPVERLLLRAVRDSQLEFRGADSNQRGMRLANWEEMLLNQYIYLGGEVIKLYQQRQGPDSDAQFYPEDGNRHAYFGSSARAHALGAPAYVVVPYPLGTELPDNGLPVFTIYYENDDDGQQKIGRDSRLTFVAPADGTYLVRVSDVRGFGGEEFSYKLIARRPQADFAVTVAKVEEVNAGSGKSFLVKAERTDNFNGPIHVDISGVPGGFQVTSPITIEAGHLQAKGAINCLPDTATGEHDWSQLKITASAAVGGEQVTKELKEGLGPVKVAEKPKLLVHLLPVDAELPAAEERAAFPEPPAISLTPGKRTPCQLIVERNGFEERIQFDVENLPHGVIVDDIGLNGVLIPEGQTQRTIYLSAEPWVPATSRPFHAAAQVEGKQASLPMILDVQ